jgi:hypothetical protein
LLSGETIGFCPFGFFEKFGQFNLFSQFIEIYMSMRYSGYGNQVGEMSLNQNVVLEDSNSTINEKTNVEGKLKLAYQAIHKIEEAMKRTEEDPEKQEEKKIIKENKM